PLFRALTAISYLDDTGGFAIAFNHHRRDFHQQGANIQGWHANVDLPSNLFAVMVVDPRPLDDVGNGVGDDFFPRDMIYGIADF
ncbi:hypothetical protein, partial [Pseudoalteromonas phenolica]|uniref:hypothetical protein n=1 Tax=Pseudoalteromonas phenolica TaxID=161398 RepID=UPI00127E553F